MKRLIFVLLLFSNLSAVKLGDLFGCKKFRVDTEDASLGSTLSLNDFPDGLIDGIVFQAFDGDCFIDDLEAINNISLINRRFRNSVVRVAQVIDGFCLDRENTTIDDVYKKVLAKIILRDENLIAMLKKPFYRSLNFDLKGRLSEIEDVYKSFLEMGVFFQLFCPDDFQYLENILLAVGCSPDCKFIKGIKAFKCGRMVEEPCLN